VLISGLKHHVAVFDAGASEWEAIIVEHENPAVAPASRPLLAVPHGGPHSAFATEYLATIGTRAPAA